MEEARGETISTFPLKTIDKRAVDVAADVAVIQVDSLGTKLKVDGKSFRMKALG